MEFRRVLFRSFGLDREGRISRTSLSTRRVSPGLVGLGQSNSPPSPMIPLPSGNPPVTISRMATAAVCHPLADNPRTRWPERPPDRDETAADRILLRTL